MDENKPRRRWLSFGIRDLLWATVVVGLGIGWWVDQTDLRLRLSRATNIIEEMGGARESHWHQLKQAREAYAYLKCMQTALAKTHASNGRWWRNIMPAWKIAKPIQRKTTSQQHTVRTLPAAG